MMITRNPNNNKPVLILSALALVAVSFTAGSASAKLLVYEPFDYPDAALNGNGGALGTTGVWQTYDTGEAQGWWCHPEGEVTGQGDDLFPGGGTALNLFDGTVANLPTSGGFAGPAGPTDQSTPGTWGTRDPTGNLDANIGLDPSVTATFQSGTTTWFSYVGCHADNRNQGSPTFMICTDPTTNGGRGLTMQNSGNGIGGVGGPPRYNLFDVYPHYFSGGVHHQTPGGYLGGVLGNHNGIVTAFCSTGTCDGVLGGDATRDWAVRDADGYMGVPNIVVGKIEWDADTGGYDIISVVSFLETDELTEAAFDAIIADKPLLSSKNWPAAVTPADPLNPSNKPNLDQSQFDLINISSLKFWIDEIRIATTYNEVIGGISDPFAPSVDAGNDWIAWSGAPVTANATVVNNDPHEPQAELTYAWTVDADSLADTNLTIELTNADQEDVTVKITKTADTGDATVVTMTLAANNVGSGKPAVEDTMTIDVYDDACKAANADGALEYDPVDFDANCITDLSDYAVMAAAWLVDYTLTGPVTK
jgi:hypothetical protein